MDRRSFISTIDPKDVWLSVFGASVAAMAANCDYPYMQQIVDLAATTADHAVDAYAERILHLRLADAKPENT